MGLDMYLSAEKFVSGYDHDKHENFQKILDLLKLQESDARKFITVSVNIGYWRKANAIHNWFVQNVQKGEDNCARHYVSRDQLDRLRDDCLEALSAYEEGDVIDASNILPPTNGFFFGNTAIDEGYAGDLRDTVELIDRCLTEKFKGFDFYYQSSW